MTPRIVAIVQARMGSSRLPGKVMLDIVGEPMLGRVIDRTSCSSLVDHVVLATTTDARDNALEAYCASKSLACWRGSQYDVLDRYYQAAQAHRADIVVRITADCPLIDAGLIDEAIQTLIGRSATEPPVPNDSPLTLYDFAANRLPPPWKRTYPIGLDVEACTFAAMQRAWKEASEPHEREHVMPYLYEGVTLAPVGSQVSSGISAKGFRVALLDWQMDYGAYRWTVDTAADLEFVRQVYAHFGGRTNFSWREVLALVLSHPELMEINAGIRHKTLGDVDERAPGERGP